MPVLSTFTNSDVCASDMSIFHDHCSEKPELLICEASHDRNAMKEGEDIQTALALSHTNQ